MYSWILKNKFQHMDFTTFIDKFRANVKIWFCGTHAYYTLTFLSRTIHTPVVCSCVLYMILSTYHNLWIKNKWCWHYYGWFIYWCHKTPDEFLVLLIIYVKWGKYSGKKTDGVLSIEKTFMKLQWAGLTSRQGFQRPTGSMFFFSS